MSPRPVARFIRALATSEGAGVTVHRTIGSPSLRNLDPFLLLDHFSSDDPDEYIAGFPDHPHRGFCTFTYMLDGHMLHGDSMGNKGDLRAGGAQWMKAGRGVIHSEMPQQSNGLMRGFQLWINLPAEEKMSTPAYQEFAPEDIPEVVGEDARVRVLLGSYGDVRGPIEDPFTHVQYLDVKLAAGAVFRHDLPGSFQGFVYTFEGSGAMAAQALPQHSFALLGDGNSIEVAAGDDGMRFLLVTGEPIREPIVQYGPFVMNTNEEIHQAFADFRNGVLGRG